MILSWLRLLRAPNLLSAASNVVAGAAFATVVSGETIVLSQWVAAALTSVCIYACGLIWNDLADEEFDRSARPERPLPRGEISRRAAWLASGTLLAAAFALSYPLPESTRVIYACIAIAAFLYNFALKHSPFLGPAALGLCRAGNFLAGTSLVVSFAKASVVWHALLLSIAAHYFLYVALLSSFARMEDSRVNPRQARIELFAIFLATLSFAIRLGASRWNDGKLDEILLPILPLFPLAAISLWGCWRWQSTSSAKARQSVIWLLSGIAAFDAAIATYAWGIAGWVLLLPALLGPALRKKISAS